MSAAGGTTEPGQGGEEPSHLERRWLDALYRVGGSSAHEVKNALNGVAVNLEVVRSRAQRVDEATLGRFAETAAEQLEGVSRLAEALLALVRPVAEPAVVGAALDPLVTLLDAAARPTGGAVLLRRDGAVPGRTRLAGDRVRLLLAELLLAAQAPGETLSCDVVDAEAPVVRLGRASGLPAPPPSLRRAAADAEVDLACDDDGWTAVFPPVAG